MTHKTTRREHHKRDGHPNVHEYVVSCQCPVCRCERPVEAKESGLSICDSCKSKHYQTD